MSEHLVVRLLRPFDSGWLNNEPTQHRLRDVTRVDFGRDYADALHLIGGQPT